MKRRIYFAMFTFMGGVVDFNAANAKAAVLTAAMQNL
jgi:hypothetical protein